MKFLKYSIIFIVFFSTPFGFAASVEQELAALKAQLKLIQDKIRELEQRVNTDVAMKSPDTAKAEKSKTKVDVVEAKSQKYSPTKDIKLYATVRPTLGYIDENSEKAWDIRDALSHAGFKASYNFKEGWQAIAQGEWGIDLSNNGDFGRARQVYVALDSPYGKVGIGKQRPVQYLFIAEYIDIFNHSNSPFAYDPESIFFVDNLVSYSLQHDEFTLMAVSQVNGAQGSNNSDLFNTGVSYDKDNLHLAISYLSQKANAQSFVIGEDKVYAGSVAYTFENDLYLAVGYQDRKYNRDGFNKRTGHTLDTVLAYPLAKEFRLKLGYFDFDDGIKGAASQSFNGFNTTLEWLPAESLRFHVEYLTRNFTELPDFNSISVGFRYDYSQLWNY